MSSSQISKRELIRMVLLRYLVAFLVLSAVFFLPAGTLAYWEAWAYMSLLLIPMLFVCMYLIKNEPELLIRRMRFREKEAEQKLIVKLSFIPLIFAMLVPGFDERFGWSHVPLSVVVVADIFVLLGYGMIFLSFRENPHASRIVEVEHGQTVVTSGPYAMIRHPMYLGALPMYTLSPLALGSYWAMIPAILIIPFIVARILTEENILIRDLNGYKEYMLKTRYRLIPGIW